MNRLMSLFIASIVLAPGSAFAAGESAEMAQIYQECRNSGGVAADNYQQWVSQNGCVCNGVGSGQRICSAASGSSQSVGSSGNLVTDSTKNVVQGMMNRNTQQTGMGLMGIGVAMMIQGLKGDPAADARKAMAAQAAAQAAARAAAAERQRRADELARRAAEIKSQLLGSSGAADSSASLSLMGTGNTGDLKLMTIDQTSGTACAPSQDASVVDLCGRGNTVDPRIVKNGGMALASNPPPVDTVSQIKAELMTTSANDDMQKTSPPNPVSQSVAEIKSVPVVDERQNALDSPPVDATSQIKAEIMGTSSDNSSQKAPPAIADKSGPYNAAEDGPLHDAPNAGGHTASDSTGGIKAVPDQADVASPIQAKVGDKARAFRALDQARGAVATATGGVNNPSDPGAHEGEGISFDRGGASPGSSTALNVPTPQAAPGSAGHTPPVNDVASWRMDQQRRINEINNVPLPVASSDAISAELNRRSKLVGKIQGETAPPAVSAPAAPTPTVSPKPTKLPTDGAPIVVPAATAGDSNGGDH